MSDAPWFNMPMRISRALVRPLALALSLSLPIAARATSSTDRPSAAVPVATGSGRIGALIGPSSGGGALVTQVLSGTPAERAGLRAADQIVKVDGHDVTGETLAEVVARIGGAPGTKVTLTVERGSRTLDLTMTRTSLNGRFNDALRDRRAARVARFVVQAQGGARRVRAIAQVHLESDDGKARAYVDAARSGYRRLSCSTGGAVEASGHDGKQGWGSAAGRGLNELARALMQRPWALLPNLLAVELLDPDLTVSYKGKTLISPPPWLPFKVPRHVERFDVGDRTLDFDPHSGMLVHQIDSTGYPVFFGAHKRVSGVAVAGQWTAFRDTVRLRAISFAPIPPERFRPRGVLRCDP